MSQLITATFEDGVLKPRENLDLAAGTKVHLLVIPCSTGHSAEQDPLSELDRLCDDDPIDSGGARLTRDQLHERP